MSRALSKAHAAVADALRDRDRWITALADAETDATRALDVDVADPADLDAAGENAARTASRVAAARRALERAEVRVADARRTSLLAEAADEDAQADSASRELTSLQGKVCALLGQLEALNGARYELPDAEQVSRRVAMGAYVDVPRSKIEILETQVRLHRLRAAVLRITATSGQVPSFAHELDVPVPWGAWSPISPDIVPDSAKAYQGAASEGAPSALTPKENH